MFMNDENKRHRQAIKIARETTNNQKKKYNSWNIYRDNNFHSLRQVLKCL